MIKKNSMNQNFAESWGNQNTKWCLKPWPNRQPPSSLTNQHRKKTESDARQHCPLHAQPRILVPCAMKSVVRSVINLMVWSWTLECTKRNFCNCKTMWRNKSTTITLVASPYKLQLNQKKTTKDWRAWTVNNLACMCSK